MILLKYENGGRIYFVSFFFSFYLYLFSLNVIRLCLSWNALEPTPGNYNEMYLQRVEQV